MNAPAPLPRLAVVIPCYNAQDWIGRAIQSALDAGDDALILVVVDDGSTDASVARVRAFGDRVILQTGPNRGACHARNEGMRIAKAKGATHVLFLDADDYMEGPMLLGAREVAAATGADMVLSHNHIELHDGTRKERFFYSGQVLPETFLEGWVSRRHFAPVSVMLRIDFVERLGGWDETLTRAQDTDLFLRAMFEKPLIMMNNQGAGIWTFSNPNSVSKDYSLKSMECMISVQAGILKKMQGTSFESKMPVHLERLYMLTREAFRLKHIEQGQKGVRALRELGFRSHPGTRRHQIVSSLIGLEAKVRIWGT